MAKTYKKKNTNEDQSPIKQNPKNSKIRKKKNIIKSFSKNKKLAHDANVKFKKNVKKCIVNHNCNKNQKKDNSINRNPKSNPQQSRKSIDNNKFKITKKGRLSNSSSKSINKRNTIIDSKNMPAKRQKTNKISIKQQIKAKKQLKKKNFENISFDQNKSIAENISTNNYYNKSIIRLHQEILEFYNYMKPTQEEIISRNSRIHEIRTVILLQYPKCKVEVFGSFTTATYLPNADIDIVLFGCWKVLPMITLKRIFIENSICDAASVQIIDNARVPIIKFTTIKGSFKIDISFNQINGLKSSVQMIESLKKEPSIGYLLMVLKLYLYQRGLNEVFTGGISSIALFTMVENLIMNHARTHNTNLGVLLIEFFELYAYLFNYKTTTITIGGKYSSKLCDTDSNQYTTTNLVIYNPQDNNNNISRNSYKLPIIRTCFQNSFHILTKSCLDDFDDKTSILEKIVNLTSSEITLRKSNIVL